MREGRNTGQALVQLVTAPGEKFERGYFVDVVRAFPQVRSVHWSINDRPAEVTNLPSELLWGDGWIEEELGGLRFRVRPNAFLQTNTAMAEKLYGLAREAAQLTGSETVWDLYCGIGTIGLSLASDALTVWGIEVSEESVACALENAELNGITNAAFFAGNVGQVVAGAARALRPARRRRRRPAARRARGQGAAPARRDRRAAPRLRLVQPDDARRRREDPARGVRLRAAAGDAGRHVPAHAARRDRRAAREVDRSELELPRVNRDTEGTHAMNDRRSGCGPERTCGRSQSDANLHVQVTGATKRFHLWQQGPAWLLGFAAIGLGFLMVLRGYDSAAGWFAVSTAIVLVGDRVVPLAVLDRRDGGQHGAGTKRPRKKPATTPTNPPTGA